MEGFWKFAEHQPVLVGLLFVFTLVALVLMTAAVTGARTKQSVAFAESEARQAEARAEQAKAEAAGRGVASATRTRV